MASLNCLNIFVKSLYFHEAISGIFITLVCVSPFTSTLLSGLPELYIVLKSGNRSFLALLFFFKNCFDCFSSIAFHINVWSNLLSKKKMLGFLLGLCRLYRWIWKRLTTIIVFKSMNSVYLSIYLDLFDLILISLIELCNFQPKVLLHIMLYLYLKCHYKWNWFILFCFFMLKYLFLLFSFNINFKFLNYSWNTILN